MRDLDFVASTREPKAVGDFFAARPEVEEVIAHGPTKVSVRLKEGGIQCDLRLVSDTEYPYALHHFTGSKEHHIALRNRALERGWSINEYRISAAREKHDPLPDVHDEVEFYRALGMDYIAPELRENLGEIDAAVARQAARAARTGQPARDVPLPHHRQRRPQHAGGNGGGGDGPGAAIFRSGRPQQEFLPGQRPGRGAARGAGRGDPQAQRAVQKGQASISGCSRAWSATS